MKKNIRTNPKTLATLALAFTLLTGCASTAPTAKTSADTASGAALSNGSGPSEVLGRSGSAKPYYESAAESDEVYGFFYYDAGTESYEKAPENGFRLTQSAPLSTFSASVDTASYTNVRRMIENGYGIRDIDPAAVRAEEFVNYFHYDLNAPAKGDLFGITTEMAPCPWNNSHKLLFVGLATEAIDMRARPASNLVFLIDVSGSMDMDNKLPLLVRGFKELVSGLNENDTVSIVTYANGVDTVLLNTPGSDKQTINAALDSLYASGGTYGEGGIQRAYELAEAGFIDGGTNRVIVATDGDFNIGLSDPDALERLIEEKRASGVYLSVLGFGMGNYKDDRMERLANCGNGNYAYIDSLLEAKRVLVEEMGATLVTVADDVKLQIEFNPERVSAHRLVGYENRMLADADFTNDAKDAAEIGAGHTVVALYEIVETGSEEDIDLRYAQSASGDDDKEPSAFAGEYAYLKIRYKAPGAATSQEVTHVIGEDILADTPGDNLTFAACAAEFAMLLSGSDHAGSASLDGILTTLKGLDLNDEYKNEFYYLVRKLSGKG